MTRFEVLAPQDGSEISRQALDAVCRLLDPERYRITLLRVAPPPRSRTPVPRTVFASGLSEPYQEYSSQRDRVLARHPIFASQVRESVEAKLKVDMLADLDRLRKAGFEVVESVRFGRPGHEIVDMASREGFDLVVMATHGRGGVERVLMGSVAEYVVKGLHVPVMLIHPGRHEGDEPPREPGARGGPGGG